MAINMNEKKIPVYSPVLHGNEKKYVNQCLDGTWISSKGEFISKFEEKFSIFLNVRYSTSVSNGTVALHLALASLGIGEGDEVIVPTLTYIASVNAISYVGAKPVFADSHEKTWNIDPDKLLELITPKTKAIMVVHLYGNSCDMDSIVKICKERNIFLIEDAAEAFGTKYNNKYVGTFGDVATFSFFGNKTITTGEGGMLVTNNKLLIDKASQLKNQGVSSNRKYWHDVIGFNYRMTNICAAIGLAQLEGADVVLQKKMQIVSWYREFLEGVQVRFPLEQANSTHSYWMVVVQVKDKNTKHRVRSYLDNHNVETRPVFYPAHKMPVFYSEKYFPVAESISDKGINLPSSPNLIKSDVKYICTLIAKAIKLEESL
jgi:perosamine synthetase